MRKSRIGIVGTGWRAGFFAKIAGHLPELFEAGGIVCRSQAGKERAAGWGFPLLSSHEALADLGPDFVVLCADRENMESLLRWYAGRDIPVLAETFAADSVETLRRLYGELAGKRIQVAEQYPFQPLNAARIALAESGLLGKIYQMQTSIPNGYHAVSVQRRLLGTGRKRPVIRANRYGHQMLNGPGRGGDPAEEKLAGVKQTLFQLDWGDVQALNDLEDNQHRSLVRTQHWLIRGERGELRGEDVLYLKDIVTPCHFTLERVMAGAGPNLEGLYLRGVRGGERGWYYRNPFMPARLMDDEIAAATSLVKMAAYAGGGESFYPLVEEIMDVYLTLMIEEAIREGKALETPVQPWTD
jgi:predicted dehydrogenase